MTTQSDARDRALDDLYGYIELGDMRSAARVLDAIEAAAVARALAIALEPGKEQEYKLKCQKCGQIGTIRLGTDPERTYRS